MTFVSSFLFSECSNWLQEHSVSRSSQQTISRWSVVCGGSSPYLFSLTFLGEPAWWKRKRTTATCTKRRTRWLTGGQPPVVCTPRHWCFTTFPGHEFAAESFARHCFIIWSFATTRSLTSSCYRGRICISGFTPSPSPAIHLLGNLLWHPVIPAAVPRTAVFVHRHLWLGKTQQLGSEQHANVHNLHGVCQLLLHAHCHLPFARRSGRSKIMIAVSKLKWHPRGSPFQLVLCCLVLQERSLKDSATGL